MVWRNCLVVIVCQGCILGEASRYVRGVSFAHPPEISDLCSFCESSRSGIAMSYCFSKWLLEAVSGRPCFPLVNFVELGFPCSCLLWIDCGAVGYQITSQYDFCGLLDVEMLLGLFTLILHVFNQCLFQLNLGYLLFLFASWLHIACDHHKQLTHIHSTIHHASLRGFS